MKPHLVNRHYPDAHAIAAGHCYITFTAWINPLMCGFIMNMNWHNRSMKAGDTASEDIEQKFHEYFTNIEQLPRKLKKKNTELWPVCCEIFQVSILFMYI